MAKKKAQTVTVAEAAKKIGITYSRTLQLIQGIDIGKNGKKLPAKLVDGHWTIRGGDLAKFIKGRTSRGTKRRTKKAAPAEAEAVPA